MPTILTYLRGLKYSLLVCTVLMQYAAQAQHSRQIQVSFTDSLMADQSSTFLYNTIKIQNNSKQAQTLKINMVCPKQWRILSDTHSDITIQPGIEAVSYTHLDVYKRQICTRCKAGGRSGCFYRTCIPAIGCLLYTSRCV